MNELGHAHFGRFALDAAGRLSQPVAAAAAAAPLPLSGEGDTAGTTSTSAGAGLQIVASCFPGGILLVTLLLLHWSRVARQAAVTGGSLPQFGDDVVEEEVVAPVHHVHHEEHEGEEHEGDPVDAVAPDGAGLQPAQVDGPVLLLAAEDPVRLVLLPALREQPQPVRHAAEAAAATAAPEPRRPRHGGGGGGEHGGVDLAAVAAAPDVGRTAAGVVRDGVVVGGGGGD